MNIRETPPDSLQTGDLITPYSQKLKHISSHIPYGIPLEIMSISLPFLLCGVLRPDNRIYGPLILDLRHFNVLRLQPEYVDVFKQFRTLSRYAPGPDTSIVPAQPTPPPEEPSLFDDPPDSAQGPALGEPGP